MVEGQYLDVLRRDPIAGLPDGFHLGCRTAFGLLMDQAGQLLGCLRRLSPGDVDAPSDPARVHVPPLGPPVRLCRGATSFFSAAVRDLNSMTSMENRPASWAFRSLLIRSASSGLSTVVALGVAAPGKGIGRRCLATAGVRTDQEIRSQNGSHGASGGIVPARFPGPFLVRDHDGRPRRRDREHRAIDAPWGLDVTDSRDWPGG
jgi:hypothetical protein